MRLLTGDETGLLKDVWLENNSARVLGDTVLQDRSTGVTALAWSTQGGTAASRFLVARQAGVVETWERASGSGVAAMGSAESGRGWATVCVARGLPSAPVAIADLPQSHAHVTFCRGGEICITDAGGAEAGGRARWQNRATRIKEDKGGEAPGQVCGCSSSKHVSLCVFE